MPTIHTVFFTFPSRLWIITFIHGILWHSCGKKMVRCYYSAVCVLFCQGTMVTQFVEGWDFVQTLGEGAYGEYVLVSC